MLASPERLTRRQKRKLKSERVLDKFGNISSAGNFKLKYVEPMTLAQEDVFNAYKENYNLLLHGSAGTGKTFIAMYLALHSIMVENTYNKLIIVRSVVPTREMGFLPGNQKEKTKVYETPYSDIASALFGRGDAYDVLKTKNIIEFMPTSFIRGISLDNSILLVDEAQNLAQMELHSIMTRVGENSKIIFCGDVAQDDLTSKRKREFSGLRDFMKIIENMEEFDFVEFTMDDCVRSGVVKSYLQTKERLKL